MFVRFFACFCLNIVGKKTKRHKELGYILHSQQKNVFLSKNNF